MQPHIFPDNERLAKQIRFIIEVDKLKQIFRQTYLMDSTRKENDAEHSWHLALMAVVLVEHANEPVDLLKVIKMVLVHDLVEIDAGDTLVYDLDGYEDKAEREQKAADRIFPLLPEDQAEELRSLWDEFEARETPEARFAAALDRLQPLMHNYYTSGKAWKDHGIAVDQAIDRNKYMADGASGLWEFAEQFLQDAVEKKYILKTKEP
ncbi:MAG: HD domain-containing protein [bacterium]|nr:HD domain-containing protein [bacterium]